MFQLRQTLTQVALLVGAFTLGAAVHAADASDQVPPENVRGETYNDGPKSVFDSVKKDKKEQKDEKSEKKDKKEKKEKDEKKKDDKAAAIPAAYKTQESVYNDSALSAFHRQFEGETAAKAPLTQQEADTKYRGAISRLGTSGWKEAQDELVRGGKTSVPYLIEAMNSNASAYHNGGHVKADSSRALRQRSMNEVCSEILRDIVINRTTYKGSLPGADAQAWQTWYSTHGTTAFPN